MATLTVQRPIDDFIAFWQGHEGGKERANYQLFLSGLCRVLDLPEPTPNVDDPGRDHYVFERKIAFKDADGTASSGWIDLYRRGSFVLEAKQSRQKDRDKNAAARKPIPGQSDLFVPESEPRGKPSATRAWDVLMLHARRQAEDYAKALPTADGWPPFVLVCDVGHCIEVYADFSGQGKNYAQFPDRQGYRIYLEDLRRPEVCDLLRKIWLEPQALDPTRQSSKVTREIAARLAQVSKRLEERKYNAEDVALFLMRCLFTMFAEDVKLLPADCFKNWLERAIGNQDKFAHELQQLWQAMDKGGYATIAETKVKRFNGRFFADASVIPLHKEEIGELFAAAKANWKEVDPAIFGTLLEQALNDKERAKLGAHYTPRAYVERLVVVTIMEPLRQEWAQVQATAERFKIEAEDAKKIGKRKDADNLLDAALKTVRDFHAKLCATRVLDPACGTGNFLYVALELMKRLEGEVLEAVLELGGQEGLSWMADQTVDPHQFLGLELNSRAAAIAELVVWLGFLQWHFRTRDTAPPEPILHDFKNITCMDAVLTWDGYPVPKVETKDGKRVETFPNARRPDWPEAEFIVGNPPFIGGKDLRANLGDDYAETLWAVHDKRVNESADLVMYWWDRAAELLTAKKTTLRRFGFVTTNSITQTFSRRVIAKYLEAKAPLSLIMAIPDHPWTKVTRDHASVRIAMTVAMAGRHEGMLREVETETGVDTDQPDIETCDRIGRINADLTVGADVTECEPLLSNEGLCSPGVKLHGAGFIVTPEQAKLLGLGKRPGLESHIRHYRNGRDLTSTPRGVMVIDLHGLDADEVRQRFPEVYQHLAETVKADRQAQYDRSPTRDSQEYMGRWWTFGKPRQELRPALAGLSRYIATVETAKHRVFQFLDASILPDNMLVAVGTAEAFHLGVLSSRIHVTWALAAGGTLEDRPRYSKSLCFDPFPFPDCADALKDKIRAVAEELDADRKVRQVEHPRLTLTQMYNVLEKLRAGEVPTEDEARIKQEGLIVVLKDLHDKIDALVLEAYGWTDNPSDDEILNRLVALNRERSLQEKVGKVLWLRPDYQIPRFGSDAERARLEDERRKAKSDERLKPRQGAFDLKDDLQEMMTAEDRSKPKYPTGEELAETAAVMSILMTSPEALSSTAIATRFAQGRAVERRIATTIAALARLGHLKSDDGGNTFTLARI